MLERLVFRPLLGGEQTGGRNPDLSLRSSPALDYARGRLLWEEPESWGASKPPFLSRRVWSAFAACCPRELYEAPRKEKCDPLFIEW
jgi:hypothetical protein